MPGDIPISNHKISLNLLNYWRASISDSMFGKGRFRMSELRRYDRLSVHSIKAGRLSFWYEMDCHCFAGILADLRRFDFYFLGFTNVSPANISARAAQTQGEWRSP